MFCVCSNHTTSDDFLAATISGLIEEIGQTWKTVLSNAQRDPPLDRERYEKILKQFPKISKAIDELKSEMDNLSTSIKTFVQHQRSFDINEQDLFKESEEQDPDRAIELQITQILNNKKEIIKKLLIQPLKPITLIIGFSFFILSFLHSAEFILSEDHL